jgi:hypothetical protein
MQRLAEITTAIEPESPDLSSRLAERLNISQPDKRRAALAEIFFLDRASAQYDGREPEDLDALVQTVLPLTRSIPVEYLAECYVVALEQRPASDNYQIRGVELLNAWKVVQGRLEMESSGAYDKGRLLPTHAANACPKCYGTGMERMPDGSVRKGCKHEDWTPEFETEYERGEDERRADVKRQAAFMKEALSRVGSSKPVPDAPQPKQIGTKLTCTNEACRRKVSTLYGYEQGQSCRELLNRGVHDGELKFCDGTLQTA